MIIKGIVKAVKGEDNWQDHFDLTTPALTRSFGALILCLPLFIIITKAVVKYNDNSAGGAPFLAIGIVLGLMSLAFPLIAYLLCMIFEKQSAFRPWVIVRNWAFLCVIALITLGFGLYLLGLLPFSLAYIFGLFFYLSILALDVSLALHIAKFDWAGAVFAAILVTMTSIMILYLGLVQALA